MVGYGPETKPATVELLPLGLVFGPLQVQGRYLKKWAAREAIVEELQKLER
jgi:hypothetical protein